MQEQESLPVDGLIIYEKKVLEKVNPFRTRLEALKQVCAIIPDITTTKGKDELRKQIKSFRDLKSETEEARKLDKAAINKFAKIVDENYGNVWDDAEKEQKERDAKLKDQIAKEEAEKKAKDEAQEKIANERIAIIYELGGRLIGDSYVINGWAIKTNLIKTSPEETWQNSILKGFKEQADIIEQERLAEEKRKQDEADKLRQEQERLRQEQEEFKKQQAELKRQQEEFEAKQREAERLERKRQEEEEQRQRWEEAERQRIIDEDNARKKAERISQLSGKLSLSDIGVEYKGDLVLPFADILGFSDEDFNNIRDIHNKRVAEDQEREAAEKEAEDNRFRIEAKKDLVEESRRYFLSTIGITDTPDYDIREMEEAEWDALWNTLSLAYQQKKHEEWIEMERVKKIQEEEREKERQADLNDGQKWREWKEKLQKFAADMPSFTSKRYSKMKAISLEKFSEIQLLRTDKISSN